MWHRVPRARHRSPRVVAVLRHVISHELKCYALFTLQDSVVSVAYVDVQCVHGDRRVGLREACTGAGEMLGNSLVRIQRRADVQRWVVCAVAWCAPQDVHPRIER